MEKLIALLMLPIAYVALVGWGTLLQRFAYRSPPDRSPFTAALGVPVCLLLGACLNHLALARPWAFDVLLAVGCILAYGHWRRQPRRFAWFTFSPESVPPLVALALASFLAWYLLPAAALNHHDDFYKYLPRFVRMLQTGSLGGNPFGFVGVDSLGLQSFLQGLLSAHLPITYINAFDPVFCVALAALLLDSLGRQCGAHWLIRALAVTSLFIFNAQYVNVSALYSLVAMILALVLAALFLLRKLRAPDQDRFWRPSVPVGLFAATIAGLKVTSVFFPAAFLAVFLAVLLTRGVYRRRALAPVLAAGGSALLLFGAWAALSIPNLRALVASKSSSMAKSVVKTFAETKPVAEAMPLAETKPLAEAMPPPVTDQAPSYAQEIMEYGPLFYGGHIHDYLTLLALIAILTALAILVVVRWPERHSTLVLGVITGSAALISFFFVYHGVYGIHVDAIVRYTAPVLIAVFLALVLLLQGSLSEHGPTDSTLRKVKSLLAVILISTPLIIHADLAVDRARLAIEWRTLLSYPISERYFRLMAKSLDQATRSRIRFIQQQVPADGTILAWVSTPFHFDYERNRIYTLATPGQPGPLGGIAGVPPDEQADWLRRRLQEFGVEFVVWEYRGPPKQRGGADKAAVIRAMAALGAQTYLYADGTWAVIPIRPPPI